MDLAQSTIREILSAMDERAALARILIGKVLSETNQPQFAEIENGNYDCIQNSDIETLSDNWTFEVHGEHCLFINRVTNQELEVSLGTIDSLENIDPYFFYKFLVTTNKYKHLASVFQHPFKEMLALFELLQQQGFLKRIHGVEFRKVNAG
ncbi:DUF6896 domain-containing protein [Hymenobacter properus]|uniref:DUF6896 domain-containing protein n=1 Tax=Hymenobacter properus TaxID=2791026 RepID=A0A931FI37_9BACT|nr:hypothetical protein [Hymenobacter properus]MBF9140353.1 hypothetical protein [Hymenobacter properus]MBR7719160.1 hypothetical protein [Microvirga sp. SRT04]